MNQSSTRRISTPGRSPPQRRTSSELVVYQSLDHIRIEYNINDFIFKLPHKYQAQSLIGRRCHWPVCFAYKRQTQKAVAIMKVFDVLNEISAARNTLVFLKILPRRNHPNIVGFNELIPPPPRRVFEGEIYIVYDKMYCDLQYAIYSDGISISSVKDVLYQILCGLKYLHSGSFVLNLLNLNSVHLNRINNYRWEVKLSDYHMGHINPQTNLSTDYVEPTRYQAPEVLDNYQHETAASDIWSAGVIFMELLTRAPLFRGRNGQQNLYYIFQQLGTPEEDELWFASDATKNLMRGNPSYVPKSFAEIFPDVDVLAIDLVAKMIVFDPNKRITAANALNHPYFAPIEPVGTPFNSSIDLTAFGHEELKDMIVQELALYDTTSSHQNQASVPIGQ